MLNSTWRQSCTCRIYNSRAQVLEMLKFSQFVAESNDSVIIHMKCGGLRLSIGLESGCNLVSVPPCHPAKQPDLKVTHVGRCRPRRVGWLAYEHRARPAFGRILARPCNSHARAVWIMICSELKVQPSNHERGISHLRKSRWGIWCCRELWSDFKFDLIGDLLPNWFSNGLTVDGDSISYNLPAHARTSITFNLSDTCRGDC